MTIHIDSCKWNADDQSTRNDMRTLDDVIENEKWKE
jgi:hypothetical protein